MTNDDREALLEFLRGAGFIISFVGLSLVLLLISLNGAANLLEARPAEKFEVVDKYKDCDVVRYTPNNSARYAYLLDCSSK